MKQSASPVIIGIAIVAALVLIIFIGYRAFTPSTGAGGAKPNDQDMSKRYNQQYQQGSYGNMRGHDALPKGPPAGN